MWLYSITFPVGGKCGYCGSKKLAWKKIKDHKKVWAYLPLQQQSYFYWSAQWICQMVRVWTFPEIVFSQRWASRFLRLSHDFLLFSFHTFTSYTFSHTHTNSHLLHPTAHTILPLSPFHTKTQILHPFFALSQRYRTPTLTFHTKLTHSQHKKARETPLTPMQRSTTVPIPWKTISLTKALIVETFEKNKNIFVSPIASFVNHCSRFLSRNFFHNKRHCFRSPLAHKAGTLDNHLESTSRTKADMHMLVYFCC